MEHKNNSLEPQVAHLESEVPGEQHDHPRATAAMVAHVFQGTLLLLLMMMKAFSQLTDML